MTIFLFYFNVSDKAGRQEDRLELDHLSLALLLSPELEVLRSLDRTLKQERMSLTGSKLTGKRGTSMNIRFYNKLIIRFKSSTSNSGDEKLCIRSSEGKEWKTPGLTWFFHLHSVHSSLSTSFFVVLAFFLKMGLDWPPKPCCLRSYLVV